MLPKPVIQPCGQILVVRDDLLPGGTKRRALEGLLQPGIEYVYAGPACGYAQTGLAYACRDAGTRATVFVARRAIPHKHTAEAAAVGANVIQVPYGYLSTVEARAKAYAQERGAVLIPFGFDIPEMRDAIAAAAHSLPVDPTEVWTVAGSGTLTRALQQAWPDAAFHAIRIGKPPDFGRARLIAAPEKFEQPARIPPPFPSCANYDAKAWAFIQREASPGALFWNVAA